MRRIGITGGSFDPVHDGHIGLAEAARERLGLDEVWLWVSHNIFKDMSTYAPLELRAQMCAERTQGRPWLKAQTFETAFHDTRTASSMQTLQEIYPETRFIWIFGDDNFAGFHNWNDERFRLNGKTVPDWQYIMNSFSVAVMRRDGYHEAAVNSVAARYGADLRLDDPHELSRERIGWSFVDANIQGYSSTGIKEALRAGEKDIPGLTASAEKLIRDHGLYVASREFNGAAEKKHTKNDVRFTLFPLLASAMNLVKTMAAHSLPETTYTHYEAQFSAAWDNAHRPGLMHKDAAVTKILAGCAESLSGIARISGVDLQNELTDYLAKIATLCVCEGLEKHRAMTIARLVFDAPDLAAPTRAHINSAAAFENYAREHGVDVRRFALADKRSNFKGPGI